MLKISGSKSYGVGNLGLNLLFLIIIVNCCSRLDLNIIEGVWDHLDSEWNK